MTATLSKKNILVMMGGPSVEHEVSVRSARNIFKALQQEASFNVFIIGLSRQGEWLWVRDTEALQSMVQVVVSAQVQPCTLLRSKDRVYLCNIQGRDLWHDAVPIDVAFLAIHGTIGEDGGLQGYCEVLRLPYVGCDVMSSALGMDKAFFKTIMEAYGLPVVPFVVVKKYDAQKPSYAALKKHFKANIFFVKPANLGSSVGISRVDSKASFQIALENAFLYSEKILIEKAIVGHEVEVSVLGNLEPKVSGCGEIVTQAEFYSYDAKYIHTDASKTLLQAKISRSMQHKVQSLALEVYRIIDASGLARVDFFVTDEELIYINEINTIPGFTDISMYPMLLKALGMTDKDIVVSLVYLALERYNCKNTLHTKPVTL